MSFIQIGSGKHHVLVPTDSNTFKKRLFLLDLRRIAHEVSEGKRPVEDLNSLLKGASPSELKALCEVTENLLKKRYPKTGKQFLKKLLPFKALIRRLACRKTRISTKRQALVRTNTQSGGLPFLVPLLAPIVGTLISAGIEAAL